ncbi:MAG: hypothetical protein K2X39_10480 [Silvanigrellaceae bacterium]|nr:hypothetical protein [Silvanigrellaceae bacterium]
MEKKLNFTYMCFLVVFAYCMSSCSGKIKNKIPTALNDKSTIIYKNSGTQVIGGESSITAKNPSPAALNYQPPSKQLTPSSSMDSKVALPPPISDKLKSTYSRVENSETTTTTTTYAKTK